MTGVSEKENKKGELIQESKGILRIFHKTSKKNWSDTKDQEPDGFEFLIPTQETRKQQSLDLNIWIKMVFNL